MLRYTALVAVAVLMLDSATDFFPDDPLINVLTPTRLVVVLGLVALVAGGARLGTFHTWLDLPVALLVADGVATTYLGGHPTAPLRELLTAVAGFYLMVGLRRLQPDSAQVVALLSLICVAAAATSAFTQVTNKVPTGFCRSGLLADVPCGSAGAGALIRAVGTFSNPNLLVAFLLLLTPFGLLASAAVAERSGRAVVGVVTVLGYGAMLTTFSRAGYVAAAVEVLLLGGAYWLAPKLGRRVRLLIAGAALLGLAAAGVLIWKVSQAGHALGVRDQAWSAAVHVGLNNPLGVGLGRAGPVISALAPGTKQFQHAHNLWLNWLAEGGVAGLAAMVLITVVSLVAAARIARDKSVLGAAGLAALAGFYLTSALDHPANLDRIDMLFWLVLGLVMAERPKRQDSTAQLAVGRPRHSASQW
ncbi:hypothetical protein Sm713_73080 [Streptomyces sp. TS71-3]|nr:hypothetical protein Sm713_73080 [Streptomyces sp. TS71-3]